MDNKQQTTKGRWKLLLVLAVCAAPMIFSYLSYYVIKPEGRTNYGTILDPRQYPIPDLQSHRLGDTPGSAQTGLRDYAGKWLLVTISSADCDAACEKRLHDLRQLRLAQGKEMERIERVWLLTDQAPVETRLLREYDGMRVLQVDRTRLAAWLPVADNTALSEHIYVIDPLGNLMMRYPKNADPNKIKKDLSKLLRASAIG